MIAQKKKIRAEFSTPHRENFNSAGQGVYYRLIALWVFCEAMIGGLIHGLRLPVSGLVVGSSAVICISLIGWFHPRRGAILRATLIVAIFKMLLSPQAGFPAYIAVFFQGALGELLFRKRRHFFFSAMTLSVLALLESGFQRILVLTIIYGNDLWVVINEFLNGLTRSNRFTNYSLWIGGFYVAVHVLTGVLVGWFAGTLPPKIEQMQVSNKYLIQAEVGPIVFSGRKKKKNMLLKITWIILLMIFLQSELPIGQPLLPSNRVVTILIRSLLVMLGWVIFIGPLLDHFLKAWLGKKQSALQPALRSIRETLPAIQSIVYASWKRSSEKKGALRLSLFARCAIVNVVRSSSRVHILSAPIGTGKTTSLLEWARHHASRGIVTPVREGRRYFQDIGSGEMFPMESEPGEHDTLQVGKYIFRKRGFEKANTIIRQGFPGDQWLVIDEIGPLEIRGEGFADIMEEAIRLPGKKIIIVVREGLVDAVVKKFGIMDYETVIKPPNTE